MASILNSRYGDQTGLFTGEWENVEAYSSLVVTMSYTGNLTMIFNLRWGELRNGNVNQLFDETISLSGPNSVTLERAIKSRWFQLYQSGRTTNVINIATSYKRAPTQIMMSDPSSNIVNISSGLNTVTTDTSGRVYGNTNSSTGTSVFVTLADPSGNSLATTITDDSESLMVAIADSQGTNIKTTYNGLTTLPINDDDQKNAMYVRPTDVRGMYQGAVEVSGAAFSGAAMLYTLADDRGYKISSLDTSSDGSLNGLYVALASNYATDGTTGNSFGAINANRMLHLAITEQSSVTTKMFDMVLDSDVSLVTTTDLSNAEVKLMHLGITNNTAATAWIKVYDMSRGFYSADPYDNSGIPPLAKLAYNIAVPAQEYRDIDCNIGIGFNDGIYFGVSDSHVYEGYNFGVGDGVFIHGTYQIV